MKTKTLLECGVVAGPLFVFAFLVEGATQADYDPLRHPVSSLALGPWGWTQIANFFVAGLLALAFAVGLRRSLGPPGGSTWGPLLVGAWAVGLLGAGAFVTDPISGYPPGTPDRLLRNSWHGAFSLAAFAGLGAACFVFGRLFALRCECGWVVYLVFCGFVFLAAFVISCACFADVACMVDLEWLLQRISVD